MAIKGRAEVLWLGFESSWLRVNFALNAVLNVQIFHLAPSSIGSQWPSNINEKKLDIL